MAETFNPDKVLVGDLSNGVFTDGQEVEILKGLRETSAVIELGQYQEMTGRTKDFNFLTNTEGAYWVGEGEKVQTGKDTLVNATLVAKKLSKNIIVSREFLNYTWSDFFEEVKPKIVEAFNQAIDDAVIRGINNPFEQSIDGVVTDNGNVVEGAIDFDAISGAFDLVYDSNNQPNAVISTLRNRTALRNAVDASTNLVYDSSTNQLDGVQVQDIASLPKGELYVGDFDYVYYGIPQGVEFFVLTEGTISDVSGSDGNPINLGERQLIALQPTLYFGALIVKDDAFAKIEPATTEESGE